MTLGGSLLVLAAACGTTPTAAPPPAPSTAKAPRPPAATPSAAPTAAPSATEGPSAAAEIPEPACTAPPACQGACAAPRQLALGDGHACALETSGALVCWGDNDAGELGDGTRISRSTPTRAQATGLV